MKFKRIAAIVLALVMIAGMIPAMAATSQSPTATFCPSLRSGNNTHNWSGWSTTRQPSCTSAGSRQRSCLYCGYVQTESISKNGHSYGSWQTTKKATCTRQGEQSRTCRVCGHVDTRKTDKAAHKYGEWTVVREATCTEQGERTRTCSVCGYVNTGKIDIIPHTWGEWEIIVEATDHSAGTRARTCQVCGERETEDYDPEGTLRPNDRGDAVTALQEGLICYGAMKGRANGRYNRSTENAVERVQEAEGLEVDGIAWPQTQGYLGHIFGEWETISELSDFSMSLRQRTCVRCGYVEKIEEWPEPVYKRGDEGDGVKALQESLNAAGFNCGRADGEFGGRTERAVSKFESSIGIEPDGIAWPGVINVLNHGFMPKNIPSDAVDEDLPDAGGFGGDALVLKVEQISPEKGEYKVDDEVTFSWTLTNQSPEDCSFSYLAVCDGVNAGMIVYDKPFTLLANGENDLTETCTVKVSHFAEPSQKVWSFFFVAWGKIDGNSLPSNEVPFLFPAAVGETSVILMVDPPAKKAPGTYAVGEKLPFTLRLGITDDAKIGKGKIEAYYLDGKVSEWNVDFKNGSKVSEPIDYEFVLDSTDLGRGYVELVFSGEGILSGKGGKTVPAKPVKVRIELGDYEVGTDGDGGIKLVVTPKTAGTVFTEGESISFDLTLYNQEDEDMTDPMIFVYGGDGKSNDIYKKDSLPARRSINFKDKYTFTPDDAAKGGITLSWGPEATDADGNTVVSEDVELMYTVLSRDKKQQLELTVIPDKEKKVVKEGETITFNLVGKNNGGEDLHDHVIQPYDGQGNKLTPFAGALLPINKTLMGTQNYTFTAKDAEAGTIKLHWESKALDGEGNPVQSKPVDIEYDVIAKYDWLPAELDTTPLEISTRIVGGDDQVFHVNDVITFEINAKNTRNEALTNAEIMDYPVSMSNGKVVADHLTIGAHEPYTGLYQHTVTTDDENNGYVKNRARIWDGVAEGDGHYFYSEFIQANVGKPEAPAITLKLSVSQQTPVKPVYFPDESGSIGTIEYACTLWNMSEVPISLSGIYCHILPDTATDIALMTFDPKVKLEPNEHEIYNVTLPLGVGNVNPATNQINVVFFGKGSAEEDGEDVKSNEVANDYIVGDESTMLSVTKKASEPADPRGFVEGEIIHYEITVENKTNEHLTEIDVNDPPKGENEDSLVESILEIYPHASKTVSFDYKVTADDVAQKHVTNTATASWVDGDQRRELPSNTVTVDTWAPGDVTVTKKHEPSLLPEGFVKGETIDYTIVVTNNTDEPITNVDVLDFVNGAEPGKVAGIIGTLYPHVPYELSFSHEVDADDVARTYVTNKAMAQWMGENGESFEYSNEDKADVIDGIEYTTSVMVFKGVEGSPAITATNTDGEHYCVGETVHYYVYVTNATPEDTFYDVVAHDPLAPGGKTKPVSVLAPGAEEYLHYDYVVTGPDGDQGWIKNTAYVTYKDKDGKEYIAGPDTIYVYTVPSKLPEGEPGKIEVEKTASYPGHGIGAAMEDDVITYHVKVTNKSDHTLKDVRITDPMYSDVAPLDVISSIAPEETVPINDYTHTVDHDDLEHTKVLNMATATWSENGKEYYAVSDLVTVNVFDGAPRYMDAEVVKEEVSAPAVIPMGYVENEKVKFKVTVKNKGSMDLTDIDIYDPLVSDTVPVGHIPLLTEQASDHVFYEYTVTYPDTVAGQIESRAVANIKNDKHPSGADVYSNKVTVDTWKPDDPVKGGEVTVAKTYENLPARGFYIEGETIDFAVQVLNNTSEDIYDVVVTDPLSTNPGTVIGSWPVIASGKSETTHMPYVVQKPDVDTTTHIVNTALAEFKRADGSGDEKLSNICQAPIGKDGGDTFDSFGVITGAEVTKKETSHPGNGKYYTRGETITYEIFVRNTGETMIDEVIVYDTLQGGSGEIASIENFYPDSVRTYTFSYTVGKSDVKAGKVINRAHISWTIEGYPYNAWSDPVISPTGGEKTGVEASKAEDSCLRTLTGLGDGMREVSLSYCTEHAEIADEVAGLLAEANDDAEILAAWKRATDLWTDALNEEFNDMLADATEAERGIIIDERVLYFTQIACLRAAATSVKPDDPIGVEALIAGQLMNRTADLCMMLHIAPELRPDSLMAGKWKAIDGIEPGGECAREVMATQGGLGYRELSCAQHATTDRVINERLGEARTDDERNELWQTAVELWLTQLNAGASARYGLADEASKPAIAAERVAFGNWLKKDEIFLNWLYPGREDVVGELMAQTIRARVIDLCELK